MGQEILVEYPGDTTTICLCCFYANLHGLEWMHADCSGHVFLAWNGREFDCTCDHDKPADGGSSHETD